MVRYFLVHNLSPLQHWRKPLSGTDRLRVARGDNIPILVLYGTSASVPFSMLEMTTWSNNDMAGWAAGQPITSRSKTHLRLLKAALMIEYFGACYSRFYTPFWAKVLQLWLPWPTEPWYTPMATDHYQGSPRWLCAKIYFICYNINCIQCYIKPSKSTFISLFISLNTVLVWFSTNLSLYSVSS